MCVALLAAALLCDPTLAAQVPGGPMYPVSGRAVDAATGTPLRGARVWVVHGPPGGVREVLSGPDGTFRLELPRGRHAVAVARAGYRTTRLDRVEAPSSTLHEVALEPRAARLDPPFGAAPRGVVKRASTAAAAVSVVPATEARAWGALSLADLLGGLRGVGVARTGVFGRSLAARGFNGVFTDPVLLLEDDRLARLPGLRANDFAFLTATALDVERVELVRGPVSALAGTNAVGGALRIVTASPIERPGSAASVGVGERGLALGAFRYATAGRGGRLGFALSGQVARAREWGDRDPADAVETDTERGSLRARLDWRPWRDGEVVLTAGGSRVPRGVELLPDGAARIDGWRRGFVQARARRGRLAARAAWEAGDAGSSTYVRTSDPLVDASRRLTGHLEYGADLFGRLELTGGVDVTSTEPRTGGTAHGAWESDDRVVETGAWVYASVHQPGGVRWEGALRADRHGRFDGARVASRIAATWEPSAGVHVRGAFNRGWTDPRPAVLFADRVVGEVSALGDIGFDVRVFGLPETSLTFERRCPGGLDDRCMFSPFSPGLRLPATGAALWDQWLVPLALESPVLRSRLASMELSPAAFAAIVGGPEAGALASRFTLWTPGGAGDAFEPSAGPVPVERLRAAVTRGWELGASATFADRVAISVDLHGRRVDGLVGPVQVATPTLFLEESSVAAFLVGRLTAVGVPPALADQIAANAAATAASVPLGTLAPDQRESADLLLAYHDLRAVELTGLDVGVRLLATERLEVRASYTRLGRDCFDLDADGACPSDGDVAVNAPTTRAMLGLGWDDPATGLVVDARLRHSGAFRMGSGVYRGDVRARTEIDAHAGYTLPWVPGVTASVTVTNLLDVRHRDFAGAPRIGRLTRIGVLYAF